MRHLYQKIYLTIIVSLLLVVLVAGGGWRVGGGERVVTQAFEMAGELPAAALPAADAPRTEQQAAIDQLGRKLHLDLALFDGFGRPIAAYGRPLPPPPDWMATGGWLRSRLGPAWSFRLPDGRWIVARAPMRHRNPAIGLVLFLGAIALAVAIAAFPVVRGLTRRLERLQTGVETLGAGQLSARVKVEGQDEVARLAASFNRAAARIEELVGAHRMLLANASHELRTPLSRLRLGLELYEQQRQDPTVKAELTRDIAELDGIIDEILLASRLDAAPTLHTEPLDLLGLAAEECAHYDDCTLTGAPVSIRGDARLLRRRAAGRRHGDAQRQAGRDRGRGRRPRHPAPRARQRVHAVPPRQRREQGRRPRARAGAAARAAARRRCRRGAAAGATELPARNAAGNLSACPGESPPPT